MKARHKSECPLCGAPVAVSDRIGETPAGWCHVRCIVGAAAVWAQQAELARLVAERPRQALVPPPRPLHEIAKPQQSA